MADSEVDFTGLFNTLGNLAQLADFCNDIVTKPASVILPVLTAMAGSVTPISALGNLSKSVPDFIPGFSEGGAVEVEALSPEQQSFVQDAVVPVAGSNGMRVRPPQLSEPPRVTSVRRGAAARAEVRRRDQQREVDSSIPRHADGGIPGVEEPPQVAEPSTPAPQSLTQRRAQRQRNRTQPQPQQNANLHIEGDWESAEVTRTNGRVTGMHVNRPAPPAQRQPPARRAPTKARVHLAIKPGPVKKIYVKPPPPPSR